MYSRYVQRADGAFVRTDIPIPKPEQQAPPPEPPCPPDSPANAPQPPPKNTPHKREFGKLLPGLRRSIDVGDLLILLILLLICADNQDDTGIILLTIGFFLFL